MKDDARMPVFCERFNQMRGDMTQEAFAKFLGLSRATVGFYCSGERVPDALTLKAIADKCKCSADWLIGVQKPVENTSPYKTAVTTFGPRHQAVIAIEELSELQKEICKYLRGNANLEHISEEMADVEIMLAQLRVIFDNDFIIAKFKREKTERIEKLIAERQE